MTDLSYFAISSTDGEPLGDTSSQLLDEATATAVRVEGDERPEVPELLFAVQVIDGCTHDPCAVGLGHREITKQLTADDDAMTPYATRDFDTDVVLTTAHRDHANAHNSRLLDELGKRNVRGTRRTEFQTHRCR